MAPHPSPSTLDPHSRNAASTPTGLGDDGAAAATADAPLPFLPADIIFDILKSLPIKSLCRFRCMSREWHALIADPVFLAAHKAGKQPLLAARYRRKEPSNGSGGIRLMDLNGNVVTEMKDDVVVSKDDPIWGSPSKTHVMDVATGEVLVTGRKLYERSLNIDAAAKASNYVFGFGRAAVSSTFKVIRAIEPLGELGSGRGALVYEVLEVGDPSWRLAPSAPMNVVTTRSDRHAVVIDGVAHFLGTLNFYPDWVVRFDLEIEEWKETVRGPLSSSGWTMELDDLRLAELDGRLCMLGEQQCSGRRRRAPCTYLWILSDPGSSTWVKAYRIPMDSYVMPLTVSADGGKLLFASLHGRRPEMQVYDARTGACTEAMEFADDVVGKVSLCRLELEHFVSLFASASYSRIILTSDAWHTGGYVNLFYV